MTRFDKVIPPGSEGKVYASVDISHAKGPIQKHIELQTDDPTRANAMLYIKADVKTYIDVEPTDAVQFTISKGESDSKELKFTSNYQKSFKLGPATINSNFFEAKLQPAANGYTLKVSIKPNLPIGTQQGVIQLTSEGTPQKEVDIPVVAVVRGPISAVPPVVSFVIRHYPEEVAAKATANVRQNADANSAVIDKVEAGSTIKVIEQKDRWYHVITPASKIGWIFASLVKPTKMPDEPTEQTVSIRKSNGQGFKMLDYSTDLSQIKIEKVSADGKNYNLKVSLVNIDKNQRGNFSGAVTVKTDDADQPELKIPVYINVS